MGREHPRDGGLTSLVAGTVAMDLFLASREVRREGWAGGLRGEEMGRVEVGVEGERRVGAGAGSVRFFCSSSFIASFLEVMVMDWRVVR